MPDYKIEIIGGQDGFSSPTILLYSTQGRQTKRYIFNCGESTQRVLAESKVKQSQLASIFLTQLTATSYSGLPGMILSRCLSASRPPVFWVHGPQYTYRSMLTMCFVIYNRGMVLNIQEFTHSDQYFKDDFLSVRPIVLGKLGESGKQKNCYGQINLRESRDIMELVDKLGPMKIKPSNLSYIIRLPKEPGSLDARKAIKLGVNVGPDLGKLKSGLNVLNSKGILIKASDVVSPSIPGMIIGIVDIPSLKFMNKLISRFNINVDLLIHITPRFILSDSRYIKWAKSHSNKHIAITSMKLSMDSYILQSSILSRKKLNILNSKLFPIPIIEEEEIEELEIPSFYKLGLHKLQYRCHPLKNRGFNMDFITDLNIKISKENEIKSKEFKKFVKTIKVKSINLDLEENLKEGLFKEIVFLGTGAALPSKYRNVTSIYVKILKNFSLLMDCGEGTYGQLITHFGKKKIKKILKSIKFIWISHIHADHHLGVTRILYEREKVFNDSEEVYTQPLIVGPSIVRRYLQKMNNITQELSKITVIENSDLNLFHNLMQSGLSEFNKIEEIEPFQVFESITNVLVDHGKDAYGLILVRNGRKLVYSGDTKPCKNLIEAGLNCDLLIHESTFGENMILEAERKRHSTIGQAINVSNQMNSKYLILTHLSQRYPKNSFNLPSKMKKKIGIAFDFLTIKPSTIQLVCNYSPILSNIFESFEDTLEEEEEEED